jgi:hypothetical protein
MLILALVLAIGLPAGTQTREATVNTPNTVRLPEGASRPPATIANLTWLQPAPSSQN